jgi:protein-arginine kinase activator protein McsA
VLTATGVFQPHRWEEPMICEVCKKDKVILVTRMKLSDEEEARDVYICDECLAKQKKKGR